MSTAEETGRNTMSGKAEVTMVKIVARGTVTKNGREYAADIHDDGSVAYWGTRGLTHAPKAVAQTFAPDADTEVPVTLNLDYLATMLNARGIHAAVEQTGGNVASLLFGTPVPHKEYPDITTEPLIAGPGWFEGPGWTQGRSTTDEFSVGRHDGAGDDTLWFCPDDARHDTVVDALVKVHTDYLNGENA